MRHGVILGAIGLSCCSAAGSQTGDATALSATLRDHVKNERFDVVTSVRGLPLGVRDGLQTLFGSQTLDIAASGAELQGSDASGGSTLPLRRLVAAGCSMDHCLVYYERVGNAPMWLVALFHWTPTETRFEWGGTTSGGLSTIDNVRKAVLSGTVKTRKKDW